MRHLILEAILVYLDVGSMGACWHGQEGALAPSVNVVKCFVHCKTLSRRIIYALFSQPVVGLWGFAPRFPPGSISVPHWGTLFPDP